MISRCRCLGLVTLSLATSIAAGTEGASGDEGGSLAQQAANPISSVISMPLEFDWDNRIGPDRKGDRFSVAWQPIVPLKLNDDWTILSRTIVPFIRQRNVFPGSGVQSGLGDSVQSFFLSPANAKEFIWGVGPVISAPTGTDPLLTTHKWSAGPTAVALIQSKSGLTYGALANQLWSVAGPSDRPSVNSTFVEPFFNKATKTGFSYGVLAEVTYDWKTRQWNAPVGLMAMQLFKLGHRALNIGPSVRYYTVANDMGAHGLAWRLDANFLFPTEKK